MSDAKTAAAPMSATALGRTPTEDEEQVLAVLRDLVADVGGARAVTAVTPTASLEREIGLGSLERAELLLRLEQAFGRELGERFLLLDTAAELARALREAGGVAARAGARMPVGPAAGLAVLDVGATTLHEALRRRAEAMPDRPHVYLGVGDGPDRIITFARLWSRAAAIAGGLRARGVTRGQTVALMLPTGLDFLAAFQGILAAEAVAVPLYPPVRLDRLEEYLRRQRGILANAAARCLIAVPEAAPVAHVLRREVPSIDAVTTVDALAGAGAPLTGETGGSPDAPALVQYTSGSTGDPKGVLLTHANLVANIRAIAAGVDLRPTDVAASWLPLYHDMGLIGTWLFCLYHGVPLALQSPLSFLARPERWLWTIHQRRATLSAAPNFAYELCVRKIADAALEGLDLSCWRCALDGSEPVSPDTLERFTQRFARYGFRPETLMPVYGLAESAVALCFPPLERGPRIDRVARLPFARDGRAETAADDDTAALRFVSVGRALPAHEVRVVDDAGAECAERIVGRIVFRGPSMTPGYYRNPRVTAAVTLPGGWMDSGDLGYLSAGELYVTGRRKDLIIKGGRNLIPQEIEEVAGAVPGVRTGCVAAIGVSDASQGTEQLVVIAETRSSEPDERRRLESAIVAEVAAAVGVPPDRVLMVPPGTVPKTPSGKIQRGATKALYLEGALGTHQRLSLRRHLRLLEGAARAAGARVTLAAIRRLTRALYLGYLAIALTLFLLVVALPAWGLVALLPSRRLARAAQRVATGLVLRVAGCRLTVEGLEHLRGGPFVLAANHASYVDVATLLALLPPDVVITAKREVLAWPMVGTFVRRAGHPTVDRRDPRHGLVDAQAITERVRSGETILFFPEGTFTRATGLRPFRLGAFETAVAVAVPVVPLALRGTRQVMRGGWALPRPGPIHLWIGPPIPPQGTDWAAAVLLRGRVAEAIAAHCGEPRLDLVIAGPEPG